MRRLCLSLPTLLAQAQVPDLLSYCVLHSAHRALAIVPPPSPVIRAAITLIDDWYARIAWFLPLFLIPPSPNDVFGVYRDDIQLVSGMYNMPIEESLLALISVLQRLITAGPAYIFTAGPHPSRTALSFTVSPSLVALA